LQSGDENFSLDYTIMKNKRLADLAKDMKLSVEPCKTFQATLKQSLIKGVDIMNDPIFSSILYSMQLNQSMNLKKKARILLPDSCVLIGIIDPTGTLEENEVFVQTRKDSFSMHKHGHGVKRKNRMEQAEIMSSIDSEAQIIEGDVLITRNPCTHPGDIRILNCVDKHELRYLFNVVVFSSKGFRPQCNMMSGGDLDGDVYFVAWDKELISHIKPE
jgi:RNA-dependent RNA polymerase